MCELKMPHVSSGAGGDDLGSTDEVKVFKDEGEEEKRSSENLTEEKSSLIDLTESEEKAASGHSYSSNKNARADLSPVYGKSDPTPHSSAFNMGYLVTPYPYHNGTPPSIPVSMASKMGLAPGGAGLPFFCAGGEPLSQPPPAHMGIPPYQLDPKAGEYPWPPAAWRRPLPPLVTPGLTRPTMYPFSASQYPYPMLSPEISQVAASCFVGRHTPSVYPITGGSATAGFRSPYPSSLPITSSALPTDFYSRFSPSGLVSSQHSMSPAIVTPGPKQELPNDVNHRSSSLDHKTNTSSGNDSTKSQDSGNASNNQERKKPHIKKPLNAFMLYMKEMRAKVVAECTLKESAAINQILGRRWHALGREEQAKYYELARRERQLHMQLYPDWSSRANTSRTKKRKRKQDTNDGGNSMKKCRARYGLDQQSQWCKPCRRKKKCVRYKECGDDGTASEDNVGSCGSVGGTTGEDDDDGEMTSGSEFSPGALSGLSSLTSPIVPSPASLASPCPLSPPPPPRPVGANPRDVNNPLSVNQLTAKCTKPPPPPPSPDAPVTPRTAISVP